MTSDLSVIARTLYRLLVNRGSVAHIIIPIGNPPLLKHYEERSENSITVTIKNMYFLHYGAMSLKPQTTIFQEIMVKPTQNQILICSSKKVRGRKYNYLTSY